MYRARDFRSIARKALKGFWALSVGVALLAMLLGSTTVSIDFSVGEKTTNPQTCARYSPAERRSFLKTASFNMRRLRRQWC